MLWRVIMWVDVRAGANGGGEGGLPPQYWKIFDFAQQNWKFFSAFYDFHGTFDQILMVSPPQSWKSDDSPPPKSWRFAPALVDVSFIVRLNRHPFSLQTLNEVAVSNCGLAWFMGRGIYYLAAGLTVNRVRQELLSLRQSDDQNHSRQTLNTLSLTNFRIGYEGAQQLGQALLHNRVRPFSLSLSNVLILSPFSADTYLSER